MMEWWLTRDSEEEPVPWFLTVRCDALVKSIQFIIYVMTIKIVVLWCAVVEVLSPLGIYKCSMLLLWYDLPIKLLFCISAYHRNPCKSYAFLLSRN